MDANRDKEEGRQRKHAIPQWMERRNFATDFDEYACSPPETEFFSQMMESSTTPSPTIESPPINFHQAHQRLEGKEFHTPTFNPSATNGPLRSCQHFLDGFRHEDGMFSSPDSTPCATPEPSPVIRRKLSIPHPQDTLQTNPGRWFYMGKFRKAPPNSGAEAKIDGDARPKKRGIKLVISNFDLNAVSPNSW